MNRIQRATSSALRATRPAPCTASTLTPSSAPAWSASAGPGPYTLSHSSRFPLSDVRSFSSSAPALASEAPQSPFNQGPVGGGFDVPLFDQLARHPEVMNSIQALAKLMHAKTGVDLQAGDKPSMKMMYKLASDPDLRAAAERLMNALRTAGIKVDPQQAFAALQNMGGEGFGQAAKNFEDAMREAEEEENGKSGDGKGGKK